MKAWDIVGYTYGADVHCTDCARACFGLKIDTAEDSEGNPVHPIFASDETDPAGEYCGDCGEEIVEPVEDDTEDE